MNRRDFVAGLTGAAFGAMTSAEAKTDLKYNQTSSKSEKLPRGTLLRQTFSELSITPLKFPTTWLKNDPSDAHPNALSFSFNQGAGTNPTERDNVVHRWGVNILNNGLQEIKSEPSLSIEFEELWETGKRRLAEYHHNLIDTNGASRRVMTTSWNRGDITNTLDLAFTSNIVSFSDSDKNNTTRIKMDWARDKIFVRGGSSVNFDSNDHPMLTQKGAEGSGYVEAIRVNKANEVAIGATGAAGVNISGSLRLGGGQNYIIPGSHHETIEFGTAGTLVNGVTINAAGPNALKLKDPTGGSYIFVSHRTSFQIRDETNQSKPIFRLDADSPENSLRLRKNGGVGFGTRSPEAGVHISKSANGGGLAMEERQTPGTPSDGTGILFVDEQTGNLVLKIRHGGIIKSVVIAEFDKA
jgi:hypothetical protein